MRHDEARREVMRRAQVLCSHGVAQSEAMREAWKQTKTATTWYVVTAIDEETRRVWHRYCRTWDMAIGWMDDQSTLYEGRVTFRATLYVNGDARDVTVNWYYDERSAQREGGREAAEGHRGRQATTPTAARRREGFYDAAIDNWRWWLSAAVRVVVIGVVLFRIVEACL